MSSNLKSNDFLIFTELLTKTGGSNNESVIELYKTDQFDSVAKESINM